MPNGKKVVTKVYTTTEPILLPNYAPVPILAPSKSVQLNPIVQPITLVPYNTMNQPLFQQVTESYIVEDEE